jgi:hypothetical protein
VIRPGESLVSSPHLERSSHSARRAHSHGPETAAEANPQRADTTDTGSRDAQAGEHHVRRPRFVRAVAAASLWRGAAGRSRPAERRQFTFHATKIFAWSGRFFDLAAWAVCAEVGHDFC